MTMLYIAALVLLFTAGRNIHTVLGLKVALWDFATSFRPAKTLRFGFAVAGALCLLLAITLANITGAGPARAALAPDGSHAAVYEAVRAFQSANGLDVDGVVGPNTFAILYRAK